jgi:hypothetical protein
MRSSSVATVMEAAPLAMATCHTHSISGLPSIGSSGFPGSREDA